MTHRRVVVGLLVLAAAATTHAAQLTTIAMGAARPRPVMIHAERIDGRAEPLSREIAVPSSEDVTLPDGLWQVRLDEGDLWAAPVHLRNADAATMAVWPAALVKGISNSPAPLRVRFTSHDPNGPAGEAACKNEGASWACWIPHGRFDLRFSSAGFAPEFRFGVAIPLSEPGADLRLAFVAGASLSGAIEAVKGSRVALDQVKVSLVPITGTSAAQTVQSNAKGFFQFKGVAPGDYRIRGAMKGLVSRNEPVKIVAGTAAELSAPLFLDRPKRLMVTVVPRLDPAGKPWRLRLGSRDDRLKRGDVIADSAVSETGQWEQSALIAGQYTVDLLTAASERWKSEVVEIDRDDVTIALSALAARIRGTVRLGGRPLEASIAFGGERGPKLRSDAQGELAGELSSDAPDETLVLVEADTPRIRRTIRAKVRKDDSGERRLDIDLPATTLMGKVLNESRAPQSHAIITIASTNPDVIEQAFTEADGSFQVAGFEPATYRLTAEAFERSSKPVDVRLTPDEPAEVELIVEPYERVQGRTTIGETPAVAAEIFGFPRDGWVPALPRSMSNENGYFELDLPPGTRMFDFLVLHPACDTVLGRTFVTEDKELRIRMTQVGGTLAIDSAIKELIVVRNGAEVDARWLAQKSGGTLGAASITIPRLVASQYFVCTRDRKKCASGYLAPQGSLTLSLAD